MEQSNKKSAVQRVKDYEQKKQYIAQIRASLQDKIVQLTNLSKTESITYSTFSKDKLRNYLKNPKTNEQNLRELSQFLYRMSNQYRRIIHYYAEMIDLNAYMVIPIRDYGDTSDKKEQYLKRYNTTLKYIRKMNMSSQIMKCLITAWREDAFFGYVYEDNDSFYIMPLEGKYCRISSVNYDGSLNFAFDFSYFRSHSDDLDYWDEEFTKKYALYQENVRDNRWQELDRDRTICLKVNVDDVHLVIPPFVQLFSQIIDLIDLQSIQSVKDELSIYKLLVARMETLSGTDEPDDFAVDVDTAMDYYTKLESNLPECVSSCISPLPIDVIEFKGNTTEDVDMISNSMSNLFKAAGVAQILDAEHLSGDEAFKAAILADANMALKILLPQIQVWHNHYLQNHVRNACPIKYIEVTPSTKETVMAQYAEAAQYGVPVKLAYASLLGLDPLEANSLTYLENDCLGLTENWLPLQSSHTQSGLITTEKTEETNDDNDEEVKE